MKNKEPLRKDQKNEFGKGFLNSPRRGGDVSVEGSSGEDLGLFLWGREGLRSSKLTVGSDGEGEKSVMEAKALDEQKKSDFITVFSTELGTFPPPPF